MKIIHKCLFLPFLILLFFTTFSCSISDTTENITTLKLNCEEATMRDFENICDTVFMQPLVLPDSVTFGVVTTLKRMGRFTCLLSVNTNSLVCFENNTFLYHLNRIGGGAGEYISLHTFAIDTTKNELIIYDRSQLKICYYELVSGDFKREKKIQKWLSNIEVLSSSFQVVTSDYGDEDYFQVITRDSGSTTSSLKTEYPLITDAIFASSFSRVDSVLYFVEPFNEIVYQITPQSVVPYLKIDFGAFVFPKNNWKSSDTEAIEKRIQSADYAFMAHLFSKKNNTIHFFHYFTPSTYRLVRYNPNTGKTLQLKNVSEEIKEGYIPFPMASYQNTYLKPVYIDELDKNNSAAWWNKLGIWQKIPKHLEAKTILLLNFQLAE